MYQRYGLTTEWWVKIHALQYATFFIYSKGSVQKPNHVMTKILKQIKEKMQKKKTQKKAKIEDETGKGEEVRLAVDQVEVRKYCQSTVYWSIYSKKSAPW